MVNKKKHTVIYCRYITKNGIKIYPKNSKYFRFEV